MVNSLTLTANDTAEFASSLGKRSLPRRVVSSLLLTGNSPWPIHECTSLEDKAWEAAQAKTKQRGVVTSKVCKIMGPSLCPCLLIHYPGCATKPPRRRFTNLSNTCWVSPEVKREKKTNLEKYCFYSFFYQKSVCIFSYSFSSDCQLDELSQTGTALPPEK